jgi:hypothetical protein
LTGFDNIESLEQFVFYEDESGLPAIKPRAVSEMWEHILEDDWWFMFEERPELTGLFTSLKNEYEMARSIHDTDLISVALDVEYSLVQPPGIGALQFGHHLGTTKDGYMFKASPKRDGNGHELTFLTGHIRTITMEPLV